MSDSDQRVSHLRALHELTADDDHVSPLWAATMITLDLQPATIAAGIDRLTSDTVDVVTPAHWFALGALRREHADRADRPGELVAALDHTLRGLEGDPMSLLGLFNRALIESDLSLCRAAEQTWRRYVEMEPDPRWRAEALDHADRTDCVRSWQSPDDSLQDLLERQIPALLEMAFEEPEWTDAWRTAEALSEMTGDSLVLRILDDIGRLDGSDKVDFREYLLIRDGVTAGSADSVAQPFVELAEKVARLVPATTPLVDLDLGRLAIYMGRFETALERLNELGSRSNSDRDPWIAGRADWLRGLALVRGGNREAALSALQRSAATFGTAGYTRAQHSVATLQAETLIELGRGAEGWQVRIAATRNLQALTPTQMLHNALIDGARSAELDGLRFAHESFLIEAGLFADERGHAISQAEVALRWGDVAVDRGRPGEALARYAQAEAIASRVGAEKIRERLLANARFGRFMLEPPGVAELSRLDRTLDFYEENGPRWRMTDLLRLSAMALSATGETSRARQRFQRASADLIHQGTIISDSRSTERFWASVQHLFDDFIAFEMGDGRVEAALEVLARARSTAFASPPVASPGFSARIRDPTLVFTVVDEQAYWWRVDAAGVDGGAFTSVGLVDRVDTLVARLRAGSFPRRLATDLFEELLAPRLEETDVTIAIMADGPLGNLPFGALVDPSTAKPFATTHSYYLITGLGRSDAVDTPEATRSVVAVGDPGSAAVSVGWPPRLPESRREASSIADLYNRATLLLGDRATATGVSSAIRNADVFHFAGHTESIGPETQGVLYLADDVTGVAPIPATTLLGSGNAGALRIVVLSACESLQPSTGRVTGILGPARAFLDAGVSTVVGTLWKARDGVLASVMTDLHSGIRAGDSPSEALRDAIASYLADPTSPCCEWASIQVVRRSH